MDGTLFAELKNSAGVNVLGPYYVTTSLLGDPADRIIVRRGFTYFLNLSLPDGFSIGYLHWDPNDGGANPAYDEDINVVQIGATTTLDGMGDTPITVDVDDDDDNPVQGAVITILDATGTSERAWGETGADGRKVFNLVAGTYIRRVRSTPQFETPADASFTVVSGVAQTLNVDLVRQSSSPPAAPGLCKVLFQINKDGQPIEGAICQAILASQNVAATGTLLAQQTNERRTNHLGKCELELVQKGQIVKGSKIYKFTVRVPDATSTDGFKTTSKKEVEIPDVSEIEYWELL